MSGSKQREVTIIKVKNGWDIIDANLNSRVGFCANLQGAFDMCNLSYDLVNIGYVFEELYKEEQIDSIII